MQDTGASPGRGSHSLAIAASRIVYDTREVLARLFGLQDALRMVFVANATEALNLALMGYLRPGDHVVTTAMEHNAMMRPLRYLQTLGVQITVVPCLPSGRLDPAAMEAAVRPNTVLMAVNHASNVVGTLLPLADVGKLARQHGILVLADVAQTAGVCPIDMRAMQIDLLAFTGHKGLLGPQGTGGLCLGERVDVERLRPLKRGGTGSNSELEEQPDFMPDKYEGGTLNAVGIAGLGAGVNYVLERGVAHIRVEEEALTARLLAGLRSIAEVQVYGTLDATQQTATVSFNVAGLEPSEVALRLDEEHGVLCRAGLHCAPVAHRTIGTYPRGTVRFGLSCLSTAKQVDAAVEAVRAVATRR
jgi:cysteine desulfurase family protein